MQDQKAKVRSELYRLLLDEEASLGAYYLEIQEPEHDLFASTSFQVAEYKKPEFQVSVAIDQDAYLNGDTINVTAEATYYFGGAVANADVHWSLLSSGYSFRYECPRAQRCPWYSWSDYEWGSYEDEYYYGGYGRLIATLAAPGRRLVAPFSRIAGAALPIIQQFF